MRNSSPRDYSFIAPIYDHVFYRPLSEGHREIGKLIKSKRVHKGCKILEVGVGSGLTFEYMPANINYTGIDVNDKMLSIARIKATKKNRKQISLHQMDAHKMSFRDNQYDLVLAPSVLTAMENPLKGMREMIRVTKKGGHIAVIANLREGRNFRSEFVRWFDPLTKKYLGFTTDFGIDSFNRFRNLKLIESRKINTLFGFPLSTYLLFEKT